MTPWTTFSRGTTVLFLVIAILLAAALFTVKARVQDVADRVDALTVAIEAERRAIHVLRAEWSHLANPGRLQNLAARHLALDPLRPDQLGSFAALEQTLRVAAGVAPPPPMSIRTTVTGTGRSSGMSLAGSSRP